MGTRTVRLDEEAEKKLAGLGRITGLSISEVLKRGLLAYEAKALEQAGKCLTMCIDVSSSGKADTP